MWLKQLPDDNTKAFCKVRNKLFIVSHGGGNNNIKHASGTQHQQIHNQMAQNQLSMFITTSRDSNADKVMAAELATQHEHSYR
jgi:hypothetical protein